MRRAARSWDTSWAAVCVFAAALPGLPVRRLQQGCVSAESELPCQQCHTGCVSTSASAVGPAAPWLLAGLRVLFLGEAGASAEAA